MKVCGFSFVRNGIKFDYLFEEAIRSILPLCDELIIAAGNAVDNTLERVKSIDPKITVLETNRDENLREGGKVFASETNKAFRAVPPIYDWAFYIQGDEVVNEKYLSIIQREMENNLGNENVEGWL